MENETKKTPEQDRRQQELSSTAVSSQGAAARHTWRNIRLIVGREYASHVTQRGFIITSIILVVLVAAAAFVPTITQYIAARSNAQTRVVVVNNAGAIAGLNEATLASTIGTELNGTNTSGTPPYAVSIQPQADLGSLQNEVKNGKLGILLVIERAANGDLHFTYYTNAGINDSNLPRVQALAQQLTFLDTAQRLGLTSSQTQSLFAPSSLTVVNSQVTRPTSQLIAGYVLAFGGSVLIYASGAVYAGFVAAGVVEEKSSRVMELLLNATTPFQLMVGKIVGIGAVCLTQMGAMVIIGIGALLLQTPIQAALFGANAGNFISYLTGVSVPFYLFFLVYFLLDFFLYATISAGLGAMVKRQDEVQSVSVIPNLLIMSSFLVMYLGAFLPNATVVRILSYIPIFSPILMLVRLALGTVAWWEFVLTIGLMLVTILVLMVFAARLYRYGVLMYGQKPGLGQMVKMMRMK
jgi:ABC-2 type transport system permease protein